MNDSLVTAGHDPADPADPASTGDRTAERVVALVDACLGLTSVVASTALLPVRGVRVLASPVTTGLGRLPLVGTTSHAMAGRLRRRGSSLRMQVLTTSTQVLDSLVPEVLEQVLSRADLNDVVARHVDLNAIVAAVNLPVLIRDSSGALTSDVVQGARIRSAAADQALGRVRDRLVRRRHAELPEVQDGLASGTGPPPAESTGTAERG